MTCCGPHRKQTGRLILDFFNSFDLAKGDQKHYQQQYADMYFLRLAKLKPAVEEIAIDAWDGLEVGYKFLSLPIEELD